MIFYLSNTTNVILLNLNTSLDCQGMKSRVILKKAKNRIKFNFTKIALEFNPCILSRWKHHKSVSQTFPVRRYRPKLIVAQVICLKNKPIRIFGIYLRHLFERVLGLKFSYKRPKTNLQNATDTRAKISGEDGTLKPFKPIYVIPL